LHFWASCCECILFLEFLKLFVVVDMDGSFPMRRYTLHLGSWLKIYEDLRISAKLWASTTANAAKSAQNYQYLLKTT
jgi:hypothetical protein